MRKKETSNVLERDRYKIKPLAQFPFLHLKQQIIQTVVDGFVFFKIQLIFFHLIQSLKIFSLIKDLNGITKSLHFSSTP